MATQEQLRRGFTLGEWQILPDLGQIEKAGSTFHIEPKLVDVLLCLAESHQQVIERETLLDRVWRKQVVGDEALTRTISELRTLLGDTGRDRRYIRTVPKRGYSLIADLELNAEQKVSLNEDPGLSSAADSFSPRRYWLNLNYWIRLWLMGLGSLSTAALAMIVVLIVVAEDVHVDVIHDAEANSAQIKAISNSDASKTTFNPALSNISSYAVIPFANLTPKQDLQFFTQGLEEDIRTSLFSLPGVKVAGRLSSSQINQSLQTKESHAIRDIAKQLDVDAVVDGTVRLIDGELRITVQLLDGETGFPMWSKRYDKAFKNILKLQTIIADDIHCELDSHRQTPQLMAANTRQPKKTEKTSTSAEQSIDKFIYGHTRHVEWLAR